MDKLRISTKDILFAWLDESQDNAYYLDKVEGETRVVNRNFIELRDLTDDIERNAERYLYVPKLTKENLLEDLNEFLETVQDAGLKSILPIAFESPHKVSAFRKILEKNPDELNRFDNFREKQILRRVEKWLNAYGIEPFFK